MNRLLFFYSMPHMGQQCPMQKNRLGLAAGRFRGFGSCLRRKAPYSGESSTLSRISGPVSLRSRFFQGLYSQWRSS